MALPLRNFVFYFINKQCKRGQQFEKNNSLKVKFVPLFTIFSAFLSPLPVKALDTETMPVKTTANLTVKRWDGSLYR